MSFSDGFEGWPDRAVPVHVRVARAQAKKERAVRDQVEAQARARRTSLAWAGWWSEPKAPAAPDPRPVVGDSVHYYTAGTTRGRPLHAQVVAVVEGEPGRVELLVFMPSEGGTIAHGEGSMMRAFASYWPEPRAYFWTWRPGRP